MTTASSPPSKARRILFALIPLALLLVIATVALNKLEEEDVIDTKRPDDRVAYVDGGVLFLKTLNGRMYWTISDPHLVRSAFPAEKDKNTYRIVIAGGSFAMGSPYVHQDQKIPAYGDIGSWLRAILTLRYPGTNFEVINAGAGAQNSERVRQIVGILRDATPDLVVVAMGNNEGYVPPTVLNEKLHQWIVYRALKKTLLSSPSPEQRPYFAPQDENTAKIEANFQNNVKQIVAETREAGIALGLATLPINWRYFGRGALAVTEEMLQPDPPLTKGDKLCEGKQYDEALASYAESDKPELAAFFTARCLEQKGDYEQAKEYYRAYVQTLPLNRTRPSYNAFVRQIATNEKVLLFDLEKLADDLAPHDIAEPSLFFDYCHLTWQGYYHMADRIARQIAEAGVLPASCGAPRANPTMERIIRHFGWQALLALDIR